VITNVLVAIKASCAE